VANDEGHQAICANIARFLCEERERQNISLNLLAQRAGVSRQTVRFIEMRERNPTVLTLLRITQVLGVALEDVIAEARRTAKGGKAR